MKNVTVCNNCNTENPFYSLNCSNCNGFLRSKISNIDFWSTLSNILVSPIHAAENIIFADHKNFLTILLILIGYKTSSNIWIIGKYLDYNGAMTNDYLTAVTLGVISFFVLLVIISFAISLLTNLLNVKNRVRDYLATYTYSFLPLMLTLFILTPVQLALFGFYWFTFNPSPFLVKEFAAYIMIFIEGLFFLWCLFLLITSTYTHTKSKSFSILIGSIIFSIISISIYFLMNMI